jgi:hypothetical protein
LRISRYGFAQANETTARDLVSVAFVAFGPRSYSVSNKRGSVSET